MSYIDDKKKKEKEIEEEKKNRQKQKEQASNKVINEDGTLASFGFKDNYINE